MNTGLLGSQEDIDAHVGALPDVLEQEDIMAVLDWTADYAQMASRIKDPDDADFHFDTILEQMKSYGYGSQDDEASPAEQDALKMIGNTLGRMENGLVPTGYERVFADKILQQAQEPDVATPA